MRIAIDARYLSDVHSGIAKYSENLLEALSRQDSSNEYVVFIHPGFSKKLKVGANFEVVPYSARPVSLRTMLSFGQKVRRSGCDFLHSLSPAAALYGVKRQILTIHDLRPLTVAQDEVHGMRASQSPLANMFYKLTFPHNVRKATWLLSVSHATKRHLTTLFPSAEHKTIVVHSGVEQTYFEPPETTITDLVVNKLKLPERYLLYVGNAEPSKNLPTMISAFARCLRQYPERLEGMEFVLALGKDPHASECVRIAKEWGIQDRIRILAAITDEEKRVLYSRATLLFFVTRGEGFGFPVVEAQASGLPVLASNDASVPEITGDTAFLVDPWDEQQVMRNLAEMIFEDSLRNQMAEAGRKNVERFSWDETARKVLDIYRFLM
jgi:glycosyltransferase involved in cell wall biosynthesis